MEQEDTSAWLHFLHTKNWNREELSEEQAAAILTLEINKQYAHSSVVAGKIYSFLQIREHLAQDEHQIYARLKLVLGKDANFKGESFLDWQNRIYWEYTALKQFGSGHRINEWRVFLRKVMKEQEDLVLLDLLAQYMKNKRYPRVIRKELRKHYHLDKKDYLHQQLREAIKIVDRKVTIRIFLLLLLYFFVVCIFNGTRSAQKEVKRKEMQPVTQEQFRQSNEENMKELHKILEGLKNK